MAPTREELLQAIEDFIGTPQLLQKYLGDLAAGFVIRRDTPGEPFRDGFWFSEIAVQEIMRALAVGPNWSGDWSDPMAPDWPPQRAAMREPNGTRAHGSAGQLFEAKDGKWVRILEQRWTQEASGQ